MSPTPFDVEILGVPQEEVALRLRVLREGRGLSLRKFAALLSAVGHPVSHTAVVKFERMELKITPDYLDLVSRATGVTYGWLLSGKGLGDPSGEYPVVLAAGLESLPGFLHDSVSKRLEQLAEQCGITQGAEKPEFYQRIGAIVRAPFAEASSFLRPWDQLSERELTTFLASQFRALQSLLNRDTAGFLGEAVYDVVQPGEAQDMGYARHGTAPEVAA
jgi:transcriptional regulator with XRE-family HTH domain